MERLNNINMESQNNNEAANIDAIVSRAMADFNKDQSQDIVHEKPTLKQSIFKRAATIGLAGGILGAAGCAEIQDTPTTITDVQPSETEPSVTTSESGASVKVDPVGTTETMATPTPTETTVETTAAPVETDVNAELAAAPEISGLSKEIQDGKVVYKAVEGNEYGVEAGKFAGEYNPNVSVEGEQVGAVALEPEVVDKILADELAKIPEGEKNMKVVIPLDITEITEETGFNIENTIEVGLSKYLGKETNIMIMEFDNPLTIVNTSIVDNQFNTIDGFTTDSTFKKDDDTVVTFGEQAGLIPFYCFDPENKSIGVENIYYVFDQIDKNKITNFNEGKKYSKGEKIDVQAKSVLSIWFDYYGLQETNTEDLLTLSDGTVVFTYPQETIVTETNN